MKAHTRIVATAGAGGATVLAELRGEAPLLPRVTGARGGPVATVHLVGGAAGPLGGDELFLDLEVGPGACLVLRTVAATVALPGRDSEPSTTTVRASVAAGGRLAFLPEPMVAAAGCHHRQLSTVEVAEGGHLVWREELVGGRHGERPGRVRQEIRLRYAGAPVLAQDLVLTPDQWASPAVLGGDRTVGSIVVIGPGAPPGPTMVVGNAVRMPLGGPVVLCSAVAADIPALRHGLDTLMPRGWLTDPA